MSTHTLPTEDSLVTRTNHDAVCLSRGYSDLQGLMAQLVESSNLYGAQQRMADVVVKITKAEATFQPGVYRRTNGVGYRSGNREI